MYISTFFANSGLFFGRVDAFIGSACRDFAFTHTKSSSFTAAAKVDVTLLRLLGKEQHQQRQQQRRNIFLSLFLTSHI